ncbi:MAG: hypothetical protein K8S98_02115 [Planctomycetes bacterium]|nr:hypothetical protein [Planctomycetota bacterium]
MVTLSVRSLAVGAIASVLLVVSMSVAAPQTPLGIVRTQYAPHPRDMVQIREGTPYVVPTGSLLVITGLGSAQWSALTEVSDVSLVVDGVMKLRRTSTSPFSSSWGGPDGAASIGEVGPGLTIPSGSTVLVVTQTPCPPSVARAWGYLSKAVVAAPRPVLVEYLPHPSDMVQITEAAPYVVPAGKLFVLSALGSADWGPFASDASEVAFAVNGTVELCRSVYQTTINCSSSGGAPPSDTEESVGRVPRCMTSPAGSVLTITSSEVQTSHVGAAWGYLADQ